MTMQTADCALTPEQQDEIDRLAELPPVAYDKSRKAVAEKLGVSVRAIDQEVKRARAADKVAAANTASAFDVLLTNFPGAFAFDLMAHQVVVLAGDKWINIEDNHIVELQIHLQTTGLTFLSKESTRDAVDACARRNSFHPVRNYLNGLQWDGVARLDTWLTDYLGVKASAYTAAVGTMFLISGVARIMRPGCQVDYVPVLEGPQGALKSSVCRTLFGDAYFLDHLPPLNNKDSSQILRGKWGVECAEMVAFSAAKIKDTKAFITRREEKYFHRFGRIESQEPRQCVIVISTNESIYLYDTTGNRRYWPLLVGAIDLPGLARNRDQLWAEAKARFDAGDPWWPSREFEARHIKPEQEAREAPDDPWLEAIASWLDKPQSPPVLNGGRPAQVAGPPKDRTTVTDVAVGALMLPAREMERKDSDRIVNVLLKLGWQRGPKVKGRQLWLRPRGAETTRG